MYPLVYLGPLAHDRSGSSTLYSLFLFSLLLVRTSGSLCLPSSSNYYLIQHVSSPTPTRHQTILWNRMDVIPDAATITAIHSRTATICKFNERTIESLWGFATTGGILSWATTAAETDVSNRALGDNITNATGHWVDLCILGSVLTLYSTLYSITILIRNSITMAYTVTSHSSHQRSKTRAAARSTRLVLLVSSERSSHLEYSLLVSSPFLNVGKNGIVLMHESNILAAVSLTSTGYFRSSLCDRCGDV